MHWMDLVLFGLVLVSGLGVSLSALFKSSGVKVALHGKIITSNIKWQHKGVWGQLSCAIVCMNDPQCLTSSYFPTMKKCFGYPRSLHSYMNNMRDVQDGGSIVFGIGRAVGQKCNGNDECGAQGSVCFAGTCLCKLGLFFNPQGNNCVRQCDTYGDDMDVYEGAGVKNHNDKEFKFLTLTDCFNRCAQEKNFTCLVIEYKMERGYCHLSRFGYLDVMEADRILEPDGRLLAQRRCKYTHNS